MINGDLVRHFVSFLLFSVYVWSLSHTSADAFAVGNGLRATDFDPQSLILPLIPILSIDHESLNKSRNVKITILRCKGTLECWDKLSTHTEDMSN